MNNHVLSVHNLCKNFGKGVALTRVLNNVSLTISQGEMVGIIGPSGSGKSTLLSILGLLDEQTSGTFELCGKSVDKLSNYQKSIFRNQHIGWIFQNFNLVGDMTVKENIAMPLEFNNTISKEKHYELTLDASAKVGLTDKLNSYPHELSGGQQQRVAIARALVASPDVLLCDEPTGNLDSENADLIMEVFQDLHKNGATILIITHSSQVASKCQNVYNITDGVLSKKSVEVLRNAV